MNVSGRCHCGALVYEAEVDPEAVVICHCTDCQQLSGSAFRTVAFTAADGLTFVRGEPKVYVKTAASGNRRAQGFCGDCGSAIYATSVDDGPRVYGLRVGTINERDQLVPRRQVWTASAQHWVDRIGELPGVPGQR